MTRFQWMMVCMAFSFLFACVAEIQPVGSFSAYYSIGAAIGWMAYGVLQFFKEFG